MKKNRWSITGLIIVAAAVFTIISAGKTIFETNQDSFQLFICDIKGFPSVDVALEIQNGAYYTDKQGKIRGDASWIGQTATIHDVNTWQLLKTVTINRNMNQQLVTIILERDNSTKDLTIQHNTEILY